MLKLVSERLIPAIRVYAIRRLRKPIDVIDGLLFAILDGDLDLTKSVLDIDPLHIHFLPAKCSLSSSFNPSLSTCLLSRNPNFSSFSLSSSVSLRSSSNLRVNASAATGSSNVELEAQLSGIMGENDLLLVGPGALGQKCLEDHPGCRVHGQTVTTDHHKDLIQMGITPSLTLLKLVLGLPLIGAHAWDPL